MYKENVWLHEACITYTVSSCIRYRCASLMVFLQIVELSIMSCDKILAMR